MDIYTNGPDTAVKVLADPVWTALSNFSVFYSATPVAFEAKSSHFSPLAKRESAVILVDVLRATTTLIAVGATDVRGIYVAIKGQGPNPLSPPTDVIGPWLGGGEEHGRPIAGGCIANSPMEVKLGTFTGAYLKFVSTNGARAISAAVQADFRNLYLACLPNIRATVQHAIEQGAQRIYFVGGGFYQSGTIEDTVCAGLGVKTLLGSGFSDIGQLDDEARMALSAAEDFTDLSKLVSTLHTSQVGRLLQNVGRGGDVDAVVTGAGMVPEIWAKMTNTILQYDTADAGIGLFKPINFLKGPTC